MTIIRFTSIVIIIIAFIISVQIIFPNQYCVNSHEINVLNSIKYLYSEKNPKIIIIGGSGCGMGINSTLINDKTRMPVYNTGTHAGLGLMFQFSLFKNYITQGDIVVMIPEYQQFINNNLYGTETALRILLSTYPKGFVNVSIKQMIHLIPFIPTNTYEWIRSFYYDYTNFTGPYSSQNINKFGDAITNSHIKHQAFAIDESMQASEINMESIKYIKYCKEYTTQRYASFILLPPAYQDSSYAQNQQTINRIEKILEDENCSFNCTPTDFCLPDSLFGDSPYHMTFYGAKFRTKKIVDLLSPKK